MIGESFSKLSRFSEVSRSIKSKGPKKILGDYDHFSGEIAFLYPKQFVCHFFGLLVKSLKHLKGNEHRGRGAQLERNLEKENFRPPSSRIAAENGICQTSAAALAYKLTYTLLTHIGSTCVRAVQKCECNARNSTR